jgi:ribosomal-protein-alanine N-acetyltransferase
LTETPSSPDALAELHAHCFETPRPWSAAEFTDLLSQKHVFLVEQTQGFALGRAVAGEAELLTLAVHPEDRRQGHGLALLKRYEAAARATSAVESFLEVSEVNLGAIRLYRDFGYSDSGRRTRYYRSADGVYLDALVLRRSLC